MSRAAVPILSDQQQHVLNRLTASSVLSPFAKEALAPLCSRLSTACSERIAAILNKDRTLYPPLFAHLMGCLGPEQLTTHIADLEKLIQYAIAADGTHNHYASISESIRNIAIVSAEVATYISKDIREVMGDAKLRAVIETVYAHRDNPEAKDYTDEYWWTSGKIRSTINSALSHLTITTAQDAERALRSKNGAAFREFYVGALLGKAATMRVYPDALINDLAVVREKSPEVFHIIASMLHGESTTDEAYGLMHIVPRVPGVEASLWGTVVHLMRGCSLLPDTRDYSREPASITNQRVAFLKVTAAALDDPYGVDALKPTGSGWEFSDPRVAKLIVNHPDRADDIASFVEERHTMDYDDIINLLAHDSSVLNQGVL